MPHIASMQFVSLEVDDQGTAAFHFRPRRPLGYRAGQHGLWIVPRGGLKPFTVASAPEEELVTLGTNLASQSRLKRALAALTSGSTVRLFGPIANFSLDRTAPSVVMLAQGMGVTPFRSMLRHTKMSGVGKRTTLIQVGTQHPFRYDTEADATEAHYPTSRETFAQQLAAVTSQQPDATFMISGTPAFVRSTAARLKATSIKPSQIKRDAFYGWSGS